MFRIRYFFLLITFGGWSSVTLPAQSADPDRPANQIPTGLEPVLDVWMRDAYILNAPDGHYYLTGTTRTPGRENIWDHNDGIRLWRSADLHSWESLGLVWRFDRDGTWQNEFQPVPQSDWEFHRKDAAGIPIDTIRRAVWAPEIHVINDTFYLTASINWVRNPLLGGARYGTFLLKSITGKAEGPYVDAAPGPLTDWIDSSLFVDEDGTVYYIWLDGRIARMKADLSGFAEPPRKLIQQEFQPEPYAEGAFMFKKEGKYHLLLTFFSKSHQGQTGYFDRGKNYSYDCVAATADQIYGPYSVRYTPIEGAGHNNVFRDKCGNWWSTYFGNPQSQKPLPFHLRPGLIKLRWEGDRFYPMPEDANTED